MLNEKTLKEALESIFHVIELLKSTSSKKKKFTIDGRLVGDIGEATVERDYDVELFEEPTKPFYDGKTSDGRMVQVKATFKDYLTFSHVPDYFLGIKIHRNGTYDEIYNGPSDLIVERYGHRKGFGKVFLSFPNSVLKELSSKVVHEMKIAKSKHKHKG